MVTKEAPSKKFLPFFTEKNLSHFGKVSANNFKTILSERLFDYKIILKVIQTYFACIIYIIIKNL